MSRGFNIAGFDITQIAALISALAPLSGIQGASIAEELAPALAHLLEIERTRTGKSIPDICRGVGVEINDEQARLIEDYIAEQKGIDAEASQTGTGATDESPPEEE